MVVLLCVRMASQFIRKENNMNTEKKNRKKIVISLIALIAVIAALFCVYRLTREEAVPGMKEIVIEVVHGDGSLKEFKVETSREYLGEVLDDEELAKGEEGEFGLFITTVDGEMADDSNQEWWCLTKGGEMLETSADQTPIADGESYGLTLTTGY